MVIAEVSIGRQNGQNIDCAKKKQMTQSLPPMQIQLARKKMMAPVCWQEISQHFMISINYQSNLALEAFMIERVLNRH